MATTIIQNFSLPGEIYHKYAIDWSADNKISVCTDKAVYVMTSYCSSMENGFPFPLHKQVIRAPEEFILKAVEVSKNSFNYIFSLEDSENLCQVVMDRTIKKTSKNKNCNFSSFRSAKWSPKGAARGGRCLLSILTKDHRLALYHEKGKDWKCLCDLSEILKKLEFNTKDESQNDQQQKNRKDRTKTSGGTTLSALSSELNYEAIKDDVYKLAIIEMTWTGMFGSPATSMTDNSYEYCYLIVATKSGHIMFWKISPNDGKMVSLAYKWDTGLGLITSVYWQQTSPSAGFLMCGSLKGILAFVPVSVTMCETDQEPKLVVKDMCKVWDEEDKVAVDQIAILKIALKRYVIVAAKQHVLVACEIALTDASIIIRNVGHSFGLHNLPITGMTVADAAMPQFRVLISTMEGFLIEIKVSLGTEEIKFQHEKLETDLDLENMMIQGLAVSPNGLLCSLVLNTSVYFDHLQKKEPLQFTMFVTKTFEDIYAKLKTILKPQFSFLPASSSSITKLSDFLECIRINLACGVALPEWMTDFLDKTPVTYENLSPMELYFIRFLLSSYVSGLATSVPKDKGNLELKLYTVDALIMRNYISKVFGSCQDKIDLLTPAQGQSLLLMADWLFKEFRMPVDSLYTALGFEIPTDPETIPAREICRICKAEVKLDNMKTGQCLNGHMFGRCCQSLLLCDVIPYYQCMSCKSVALQDVWCFGSTCTYCGMLMT